MKKILLIVTVVMGIVYDATMSGVIIIAENNDTVFVSTMAAKDTGYQDGNFGLNDTLTIQYKVMDRANIATVWEVKPVCKTDLLIGT